MIKVVPFKREHLRVIEPQQMQSVGTIPESRHALLEQWWSFTVFDEQSRVLMCAGAVPDIDQVWWGWAILSRLARRRMLSLTRAILWMMRGVPADKVKMAVHWPFKSGHAWARVLGFSSTGEVHKIGDAWFAIYVRGVPHGS